MSIIFGGTFHIYDYWEKIVFFFFVNNFCISFSLFFLNFTK